MNVFSIATRFCQDEVILNVSMNIYSTRHIVMVIFVIGYVHGGNAFNVIPEEVVLGGTIRLFDKSIFETLWATLTLRVKDIASAYGCSAEVINRDGESSLNSRGEKFTIRPFPPMIGDGPLVDLGIATADKLFGEDTGKEQLGPPLTGSEDFAFLAEIIPGAAFFIGTKHPDHALEEGTGVQVSLSKQME